MSNVLIEGRVVVCSACRFKYMVEDVDTYRGGGDYHAVGPKPLYIEKWYVVAGIRHFDMIMHAQIDAAWKNDDTMDREWEQGFLDQYGVFMDRVEALAVATAAGQINTRRSKTDPEHELFSEDVW